MSRFAHPVRQDVRAEFEAAAWHESRGEFTTAFHRLERAHVLGRAVTREHVRVHWAMLRWAVRQHDHAEAFGQLWRTLAAALTTAPGWVPLGNTGGADADRLAPMPVPEDLQQQLDAARGRAAA